jgi:hypothetical protein
MLESLEGKELPDVAAIKLIYKILCSDRFCLFHNERLYSHKYFV